ncbi:hypothetical protein BRADI_5g11610v3 [Brachypodium distachyon]|uniref:Uncharacterized protein n=1 Tax=Brachypodium distachyon TaxID=15368 RepID=A0A2K2CGP0_BRADI|nr:hypothetical protein BRADI_5g11610v3 [Brachypodium distachyon]
MPEQALILTLLLQFGEAPRPSSVILRQGPSSSTSKGTEVDSPLCSTDPRHGPSGYMNTLSSSQIPFMLVVNHIAAGMTIPTLALEIDISNKESGEEPLLNLKGYFAGNPMTDDRFDTAGKIQFFHGMGVIPNELYEIAKENCRGNYSDPPSASCAESMQAIDILTKDINLSHILAPSCETIWSPRIQQAAARDGASLLTADDSSGDDIQFLFKCRSDSHQLSYIWANDEAVRESLAVRKETKGEWKRCDFDIPYTKDITSTVEHHLSLRKEGYPALIYSGDHDSKFSFVGTQAWIRSFNLSITDDWRPWYVDGQVAGFTRSFSSNLTYATVKGAGHTAPEYKSKDCLAMFARWISGEPL